MLESGVFLQYYGTSGGGPIGNILAQWQSMGVFDFILPFLLIFALIFTIMSNINLFKGNKGVNAVIALSISLMSLQFGFVSEFFAQILPGFGVIMGILLLLVIVGGFFGDFENKGFKFFYFIIGLVMMGIILFNSASVSNYLGPGGGIDIWYYLGGNLGGILAAAVVFGAIAAIVNSTKPEPSGPEIPSVNPGFNKKGPNAP